MLPQRADIVIVGGGPAGSMTAYHLAKAGANVAVIDRSRFPRPKACGGGVQLRSLAHIPFDISPVVQNTMVGISFSYKLNSLRNRFTKLFVEQGNGTPKPLVYGVLRSEFDNFLLERAESVGAKLYQATAVTGIERCGSSLRVLTRGAADFECRFIVGADGANSIVTRELNRRDAFFTQVGIYSEIPRELIRPHSVDDAVMRIDWGTLPTGYAWVFPKRDTINVGVGGPEPLARELQTYFSEFLLSDELIDVSSLQKVQCRGHKLPTMTLGTRLAADGILLVGDAAGLVEPLTGDGISHALHSAHLAANTIIRALDSSDADISEYNRLVRRSIWPDLMHARGLLTALNTFPHMFHRMFSKNESPWRGFCRVLRGDDDPDTGIKYTYQYFRAKKLGAFKFIWPAIDRFTEAYTGERIRRGDAKETGFQRIIGSVVGPLIERI